MTTNICMERLLDPQQLAAIILTLLTSITICPIRPDLARPAVLLHGFPLWRINAQQPQENADCKQWNMNRLKTKAMCPSALHHCDNFEPLSSPFAHLTLPQCCLCRRFSPPRPFETLTLLLLLLHPPTFPPPFASNIKSIECATVPATARCEPGNCIMCIYRARLHIMNHIVMQLLLQHLRNSIPRSQKFKVHHTLRGVPQFVRQCS